MISCLFVFWFSISIVATDVWTKEVREFKIDYENNRFLKDGEPFQYISGSLHYFRVPRVYWQDRLRKLRAAGLNVVSLYVEWSRHEPQPGVFDFTGENDLEHFIKLAEEEGLLVILRPGPYICAERDLGGYPVWLLHKNPKMQLRTSDPSHTKYVQIWIDTLLSRLEHLLYGNGGPIIMVQVENEYGSYSTCDRNYTLWLRDLFVKHVGTKAVLFTTDGAAKGFLKCGPIPGVFITVDFGSGANITKAFEPLRAIQPKGPLVNSEFYPGWLTHWGESVSTVETERIVNTTRDMLQANVSFNYYMFFGGTNFGYTSGANYRDSPNTSFQPQLTSYDYDAPITEAGDLTQKYFAIRSVISEFVTVPGIPVENSKKFSYSGLVLDPRVSLFDSPGVVYPETTYPKTFEELGLYTGFLLYETRLPETFSSQGLLTAKHLHDRALVYIDKQPVGILDRSNATFSLNISGKPHQTLSLLVENQGHINYGIMSDLKGLTENVTLNGDVLLNWKQTGFPTEDVSHVVDLPKSETVKLPAFYSQKFQLTNTAEDPGDTFVDMSGWTKGVVYVNGHNLGRYWSTEGPQQSLFLPGPFLHKHPEYNTIVVLELETENSLRKVFFSPTPVWSSGNSR
ncbi:beta-galactosidase-like isoform X2 [Macrosteles quadrilineatus]|uniref:beta-galactosidase-like isoform X2 n=1 Tax=Macrosteles quadrilineatus TaxID=74068 RepID=UPI0023E3153C|nr:beta-galactosidase-like isoform X2 [Macrosteles quadrilineatus]